jgi:hypothetical protein
MELEYPAVPETIDPRHDGERQRVAVTFNIAKDAFELILDVALAGQLTNVGERSHEGLIDDRPRPTSVEAVAPRCSSKATARGWKAWPTLSAGRERRDHDPAVGSGWATRPVGLAPDLDIAVPMAPSRAKAKFSFSEKKKSATIE